LKKLVSVIFAILLLSSVGVSSAKRLEVKYDPLPNQFEGTPTFCTKEPSQDPTLPESIIPILLKKTKANLDAWIGPLKSSSMRDAKWDINYIEIPRAKQASFDYAKCNVIISFLKNPPKGAEGIEILGLHYFKDNTSHVEIYYQGYGICETKDSQWTYWYTCQQDSPKLIVAMEAILRHELGHAMGLGHYISEELFYTGGLGHPSSIMVSVLDVLASPSHLPLDPELMEIMPVDIAKLKEIYGNDGWGKTTETVAKEKTHTKIIQTKPGKVIIEKITTQIPDNLYRKGQKADVIITHDKNTDKQKVLVNSKGNLDYSFRITDRMTGKYEIAINYLGKAIKKFSYDIR
jgi:hypothetical protein